MKRKIRSLLLFTWFSIYSLTAFSSTSELKDISYKFNQEKIESTQDSFLFLRSFVDYYYYLIAGNPQAFNLTEKMGVITGWCVGDAHPENFGILLLENRQAIFTMNDMDDSGPCPVAHDLLRLLVSSRLYSPHIDSTKLISSYKAGLNGKKTLLPDVIKSMTKSSLDAGVEIPGNDIKKGKLKRKKSMSEVDTITQSQIHLLLTSEFKDEGLAVLDIVATQKTAGGSAGLKRYEILITNTKKQLIKLELKELTIPSIAPIATTIIPDQISRMKKSLQITQGSSFSHYYRVFSINGKSMLLRPKFGGNIGVSLKDSNMADNELIIEFEAYILGRLHANSANINALNNALLVMTSQMWESDISILSEHFIRKFNELKKR
ncbi:MAG: DUF2252 family protein [Bacteriovorax sp.]|jgi:hypothetical protein|nr:DUF2252 family protein [Bacteriovorax sp.]